MSKTITTKKSSNNTNITEKGIQVKPVSVLELVKDPVNYTGLCGYGLVQFGEVRVENATGKGTVEWKGKQPTKVHITPPKVNSINSPNYQMIEIETGIESTIGYMRNGVYMVTNKEKYPGGVWRVRFFKPTDIPVPVVDAISVNVGKKIIKNLENAAKKDVIPVTKKSVDESTYDSKGMGTNTCTDKSSCKITEILVKFAEKIDKDFNLMSVCDVSARKYAEDYVKKELKGVKFDLEKACSEFNSFLNEEVEDKVKGKNKEKVKDVEKKKVKPAKPKQDIIGKDVLEKVVKKVSEKQEVKKITDKKQIKPINNTNGKTTVISLKGKKDERGSELEKAPKDVVYIGRKINRGGWNLKASEFCNPYNIDKNTPRDESISKYREYMTAKLKENDELKKELLSYKGKQLSCWCSPEACHGDVLCDLITKIEKGDFDEKEKEVKDEDIKEKKGKGEGRKGRPITRSKQTIGKVPKEIGRNNKSKKVKNIQITEEEFKAWFEGKEYKVADIREIMKGLEIPGITNTITKKAMKDIAEKYVVKTDD